MLNIKVQTFRGIRQASIACSPIALLCGQNEQGKSSIIDAVRSLLSGEAKPYGLNKDQLQPQLVHKGSDQANVTLIEAIEDHDDRVSQMRWPSGDIASAGAPFRATDFATGARRFTKLPDRDRAQVLSEYLKTEPTEQEFMIATEGMNMTPTETVAVWKDIVALGWDGAHAKHKTEATKLKGGWEQITGGSYGIKIGGNWRPKNWTPDHEALTDDEVQQYIDEDTKALEDAIGTVAINDDEKKRLEAAVKNIPKLTELLESRGQDGKRAKATLELAENALRALPILPKDKWPSCPHCNEPIQIMGTETLKKAPKPLGEKERVKLENDIQDAERIHKEVLAKYDELRIGYQTVQNDLKKAQDAKAQLESAGDAKAATNLDELRQNLANSKETKNFKDKIRAAVKQHALVIAKLNLVEALAPEGLRQTKMAEKLSAFNEKLAELCGEAGWSIVAVEPDGVVTLDGVRYALCSGSGRARCDVTLQVAFAMLDGSEIILVDEADIFDGKGRNGLFALLTHSERYAVVGMMLTKAAQAPDLSAAELGQTFWISEALAMPLDQFKAKAA